MKIEPSFCFSAAGYNPLRVAFASGVREQSNTLEMFEYTKGVIKSHKSKEKTIQ